MNALQLHDPGPGASLRLETVPRPTLAADQILVEVKAIGINPVDVKVHDIDEVATMICGDQRPVGLGWDVAGTVVETGADVQGFQTGDRVFGMVNFPGAGHAYAELVAAPAGHVALIPDNTSFEAAAATTLAALTALQVLRGRVSAGDRVLIHAGSGGVGHYAIQLAKAMGADVTTTCSLANRDFVMGLGADAHVDYRATAFDEVLSDFALVVDALGGDHVDRSLKVTRDGGRVVVLPSPPAPEQVAAAEARGISLEYILVTSNGDDMRELGGLLAEDRLRAHVSKTFAFAEMAAAHDLVRSGRTVGKVVVRL